MEWKTGRAGHPPLQLLTTVDLVCVQVEYTAVITDRDRDIRCSIERYNDPLVNYADLGLFPTRYYRVIDNSHVYAR